MKNICFMILMLIFCISCGKEKTVSEELVGEWLYERETFNSFSVFEDPDTQGTMIFNEDETGIWASSLGFSEFKIEWDTQVDDSKISITRRLIGSPSSFETGIIYDLTRTDENNFTFTRHIKFEAPADSLDAFEQFENILLTRI